jgi:hypothetical protein
MPCPVFENLSRIKFIVNEIRKRNISAMINDIQLNDITNDDTSEDMW